MPWLRAQAPRIRGKAQWVPETHQVRPAAEVRRVDLAAQPVVALAARPAGAVERAAAVVPAVPVVAAAAQAVAAATSLLIAA